MVDDEISKLRARLAFLERENGRLKAAIRASPAGIVIARAPDGVIEHWNPAALRIAGTAEERLAEVPLELRPTRWPIRHLDGTPYQPDERPLLRALKTGDVVRGEEFLLRGEDGKERRVEAHAAPVRDAAGNITAAVIVFPDITQRTRVELTAQRFSEMATMSPDFVGFADADGAVEYVNPAGLVMCGYPPDWDVYGMTFADFHPETEAKRIHTTFFADGATVTSGRMNTKLRHRDGTEIPASMVLVVHLDKDGNRNHLSAVMQDQRPLLKLQEQLTRGQRMDAIGRLAGGIAHDFNNLLTIIKNYGHLAAGAIAADSDAQDDLRYVREAADRAATLCRQLLSFARRQVISPVPVKLKSAIDDLDKLLSRTLPPNVRLNININNDIWDIAADPTQLAQVLLHLSTNACDAMPEGGELTISAANVNIAESERAGERPSGAYVQISVSDTGTGISEESQRQVFEPFFSTKPETQNSGLGLAMVHGAVRQNGGFIEVTSEVGDGATFDVFWPRALGADVVAAEFAEGEKPQTWRTRVLVAEDDDLLRSLTVRLLEGEGYEVHAAVDGVDAVRLWSKLGSIDLLLTDVIMPNMNGRALADELSEKQRGLPVLFMSGYTDDLITDGGVLPPGVEFLSKPFNGVQLINAVRRLVSTTCGRPPPA